VNELAGATSPYLRQHAENPVDWREWTGDALAEAVVRDVPILLSVGYSACHWCHVMAHESFEDVETAALMNENFVCVKVDREERPDLDAVYMNATVGMTGHGGWPMTCFLTPTGEPFYCGTYYPKTPRHGMPAFTAVLEAIADAWRTRRGDVDSAAAQAAQSLREQAGGLPAGQFHVDADLVDHAVAAVLRDEDAERGGFGGPPKFPPSALLEGLLRDWERTGDPVALRAVERTCEAMARGGIYDQLRGGFARYAVDDAWVVPHFEKMLYDNALLLRVYAHLARRTESPLARRIASETARFLLDDLSVGPGFASALDADTAGVEGATYVWTPAELVAELGSLDGAWAAELFAVTTAGTFEQGTSVLQLPQDPDDPRRYEYARELLRTARDARPQPARDGKVVTAWNGMAVTALVEAGSALERREWIDAAADCARHLLEVHLVGDELRRASLGGRVGAAPGVLEDYAWLARGLFALHQVDAEPLWALQARRLLDLAIERFADADSPGSWFDSAHDAETLIARPRDPLDGATPSGASVLAEALLTAAVLSEPADAARYSGLAGLSLDRAAVLLASAPRSAGHWLAVAEAALAGPMAVAVACHKPADAHALLAAAHHSAPGGSVILAAAPDSVPLLADRPMRDGVPTAYLCRGTVCEPPLTDAKALQSALRGE
jgi:uncharacterized protein